jgi:hypothetical protein
LRYNLRVHGRHGQGTAIRWISSAITRSVVTPSASAS